MSEKKDHDFVKDVMLDILNVEARMSNKIPDDVMKVVFNTKEYNITYKPTQEKIQYIDGIKVISKIPCNVMELPEIIRNLGREIQNKGKVRVKASYSVWHTTLDGQPITYRFIQGNKTIEKWSILKSEKPKEESVKEN